MYQRIMLKLSGEALSGEKGHGLDLESVKAVGEEVRKVRALGTQICVVIGGGNYWRGRTGTEIDRNVSDQIGMLGTVMNCLYVADAFANMGMETAVYSAFPVGNFVQEFNQKKAMADLKSGKIVFFAGGTGHPYVSTDMCTALRAVEMECECILMAKNVDGVYNMDPVTHPEAQRYDTLTYRDFILQELKVMDLPAAALCMENKMVTKVFALKQEDSILKAVSGEIIGSTITV